MLQMKAIPFLYVFLSIVVISTLMHYPHFSKDLMSVHVWRQTQTQTAITNFYEEDMNILNPRRNDRGNGDGIYRMEVPLMQWLVAVVYHGTGPQILVTRLCMFVIGLLSVLGMYRLLRAIFKYSMPAAIGAWAFNFSPCFYYYTINPLPDNLALCCSIWGLAVIFQWNRQPKWYLLPLSGLLLAVGALCKLPFILYFIVPAVLMIQKSRAAGNEFKLISSAAQHFAFIGLPIAWYVSVIPSWSGNAVVSGALDHAVMWSEWFGYLVKNIVTVFPEMMLNYAAVPLFAAGFYFLLKQKLYRHNLFPSLLALLIMITAYFLYELNIITSVHDYYLFPFFPILFLCVAYGAFQFISHPTKSLHWVAYLLLLALPLTAYLRMQVRWNPDKPGFNKDLLVYRDELRSVVPKDALVVAGNDISHHIMFYYIDKKGWGFDNHRLDSTSLQSMMQLGARFLYSDSRDIDQHPSIVPLLDTLMMERGSIRVFQLKNSAPAPGE